MGPVVAVVQLTTVAQEPRRLQPPLNSEIPLPNNYVPKTLGWLVLDVRVTNGDNTSMVPRRNKCILNYDYIINHTEFVHSLWHVTMFNYKHVALNLYAWIFCNSCLTTIIIIFWPGIQRINTYPKSYFVPSVRKGTINFGMLCLLYIACKCVLSIQ